MSAASAAFLNGCAIGGDREDGPSGDLAIPQLIDRDRAEILLAN